MPSVEAVKSALAARVERLTTLLARDNRSASRELLEKQIAAFRKLENSYNLYIIEAFGFITKKSIEVKRNLEEIVNGANSIMESTESSGIKAKIEEWGDQSEHREELQYAVAAFKSAGDTLRNFPIMMEIQTSTINTTTNLIFYGIESISKSITPICTAEDRKTVDMRFKEFAETMAGLFALSKSVVNAAKIADKIAKVNDTWETRRLNQMDGYESFVMTTLDGIDYIVSCLDIARSILADPANLQPAPAIEPGA